MLAVEDIFSVILVCATVLTSVGIAANMLDRRHKRELDFERRRIEADSDTALMKAKIYADKDLKIANMENSILDSIPDDMVPDSISQYMPLLESVMKNPDQLNQLLNKVKGGNNGKT